MNWLERARREICAPPTANTADGNLTAATAVPTPAFPGVMRTSIGSNGCASGAPPSDRTAVLEEFDERAAIMEFDGGLTRDAAEQAAWGLILDRRRLH